jgi:hypothetical protein
MTLAWAEYKNGLVTDAQRHVAEALRLGWRDPRALERAAVISGVSAR